MIPARKRKRPIVTTTPFWVWFGSLFALSASAAAQQLSRGKPLIDPFAWIESTDKQPVMVSRPMVGKPATTHPTQSVRKANQYTDINNFSAYLILSPSAFSTPKGKVSYRNTMLLANQFDIGVTDFLSVGATTLLYPDALTAGFSAKISFPVADQVRIGVKGQYFFGQVVNEDDSNYDFDYVQAMLTLGRPDAQFTLGYGRSLNPTVKSPFITLAYLKQMSRMVSLIAEYQYLTLGVDTAWKLNGGLRLSRHRHAFDISFLYLKPTTPDEGSALLPWFSYQVYLN